MSCWTESWPRHDRAPHRRRRRTVRALPQPGNAVGHPPGAVPRPGRGRRIPHGRGLHPTGPGPRHRPLTRPTPGVRRERGGRERDPARRARPARPAAGRPGHTYRVCLDGLDSRLTAMAELGCTVATTVLNPRTPLDTDEARAVARERISQLATAAAGYGVRLAVEAVSIHTGLPPELDGPHPLVDRLPQLAQLLDETDAENAGVLVDSFHWAAAGADPGHITALGPDRITHVQIADTPATCAAGELTDSRRLFPGDGALAWPAFADALARAGYAGPVSVELFNPELRALPAGEIACLSHRAATGCWTLAEASR
ncbi:sugar phosphate isomerase/epimerase family protein [Streptomyces sp. GLT-R25]